MNEREDTVGFYEPWTRHTKRYRDRFDAGRQLAKELGRYRGRSALVLGIPRGGVPVAYEVARTLGADLDVIVARKMGAPGQRELALGAITADGTRYVNQEIVGPLGVTNAYLEEIAREQQAEAQRREERFRRGQPALAPKGRIVILVDDGLATGATMRAAVRSLKQSGAKKLIVAVPVGAPETCAQIASEVDELVCPEQPDPFFAVGLHYDVFEQTSDEEVQHLLSEHHKAAREAVAASAKSPHPGPR